jgi:hypothetical protein
MKLLWSWLLDSCDNAGVIDADIELASFQIGYPYPIDTLSEFGHRVIELPCGKFFIPKFIDFQYGTLSRDCKAHNPIFLSLEKHGLKGYPKGIHTLQEKEKEKEQEKEQVKEEEQLSPKPKARGTVEEFKAYAVTQDLPESDGEFMFNKLEGNGWMNGKSPVKDWKAVLRTWKGGEWLPSIQEKKRNAVNHIKPKQLSKFDLL